MHVFSGLSGGLGVWNYSSSTGQLDVLCLLFGVMHFLSFGIIKLCMCSEYQWSLLSSSL